MLEKGEKMTAGEAAGEYGAERDPEERGIRERLSSSAEDKIGKLADELLENPIINSALQTAFSAREKMAQAQETAMEALNLPSASNVDKLARRLRSISQRLDEIEDGVERANRRLEGVAESDRQPAQLAERLERLDHRLDDLTRDVAALRRELAPGDVLPAAQTRAVVPEG
jgi:predicted RNase H-like nuclease (RuvC/YqgF family)